MGNISTAEEVSSYIAEPISPKTFLALIVSWSLLGILSAGLNILVCAMVYIDKKLRTITNYLVVSLSVSDLLIAVVFVPFFTSSIITLELSSEVILWHLSYWQQYSTYVA